MQFSSTSASVGVVFSIFQDYHLLISATYSFVFAFANPLTVSSHFYFDVTYNPPSISSLSQKCEDAAPHSTASQLTAVLTLVQSHSIRPVLLIRRHRMQCLALEICMSQHALYSADWEILIYSNTKRYNLKKPEQIYRILK